MSLKLTHYKGISKLSYIVESDGKKRIVCFTGTSDKEVYESALESLIRKVNDINQN